MQTVATQAHAQQVRDLCDQFEQQVLITLLPASLCATTSADQKDSDPDGLAPSSVAPELFRQALAAAIERAGGIGLGSAFAHTLIRDGS